MAKYLSSPISWSWSVRAEWVELTSLAVVENAPTLELVWFQPLIRISKQIFNPFQKSNPLKSDSRFWIRYRYTKHGVTTPLRGLHCQWSEWGWLSLWAAPYLSVWWRNRRSLLRPHCHFGCLRRSKAHNLEFGECETLFMSLLPRVVMSHFEAEVKPSIFWGVANFRVTASIPLGHFKNCNESLN